MTPEQRSLRARIAAHTSWAQTNDRTARTSAGTAASLARFERQVDPDGTLPPAERTRRAESAKKAYFSNLSRKSAAVRAKKKTDNAAKAAELRAEFQAKRTA